MAKRYENGDGVKKDFNKAFDLYRKAAEAGNADAQYNLGTCYYNGIGTEKNIETGMEWINKAAAQGHALAKTRQETYQKEKRYHGSYWISDDNWKINFQNGHYLMNDGSSRWYGQTKDFFIKCEGSGKLRLYEKSEFDRCIDESAISCTSRVTLTPKDMEKFNSLKSQEQSNLIRENLKYLNLKSDGEMIIRISSGKLSDWDYNTIGYYENGKYKSNEYIAAEKEKAFKAKLAPYTRKFGFNPSDKGLKQLVTVGRSFSLLCDYFQNFYVQGSDCYFSFAEDTGISKAYRVIKNKKRVGHVYVQRDRIISVKWY
jgi:TPR repeat protein